LIFSLSFHCFSSFVLAEFSAFFIAKFTSFDFFHLIGVSILTFLSVFSSSHFSSIDTFAMSFGRSISLGKSAVCL